MAQRHPTGNAREETATARTVPAWMPALANVARRAQAGLWSMLAGGLGEAVWLFVTLRIALSLFALLASFVVELPAPCTWENGPLLNSTGLSFRLVGVWQRWDACWYLKVATLGYQPGDPSVAFFPLYPRLIQFTGPLLAGNSTLGALVVSGVGYIAAMAGLYHLVELDFGDQVARRTILYLSIFPSAFFFFAPFTEALFLALAVWTMYSARRGAWYWAPLPAFWIGLARLQGCVLMLPLAWEFARQWRRAKLGVDGEPRPPLAAAFVSLLPLSGLVWYVAYSRAITGWTIFEAQQTWGQEPSMPWATIAQSWQHTRTRGDPIEALNLGLLLLFAILFVAGLRRLPVSYSLYAAPQLLLPSLHQAFFSPLMSTSRYLLVVFPVFVVLALLGRHRRPHYSWLILSLMLLGFLLFAFLSGPFVA